MNRPARRIFALLLALLAVTAGIAPGKALAQVPLDRGTVGTALQLRTLDGVKRVLLIGAHPDDEDTALLTALARGMGAETAYLSLTRGDGGQNLIGPELGEGLGVIRTGELLAARELDGGEQYFTRAFDFGYSKSADEALRLWPREELLRDVVWVVRSFRPQVIVSIFSGTPADGHGQHQAAGIMAREAFEAAADPARFTELTRAGAAPWQADKLYMRPRGADPTTTVETGTWDPLLGRSHFQLAMESRSQHRSQDMGMAQTAGGRTTGLILVDIAPGVNREAADDAFFAAVDTTLTAGADRLAPGPRQRVTAGVAAWRAALDEAREALNPADPFAAVPALTRGLAELRTAADAATRAAPGSRIARVLTRRVSEASRVLAEAAGITLRVRADDDLVVPGQSTEVTVELWNGGPYRIAPAVPGLELPDGWDRRELAVEEGDDPLSSFFGRGAPRDQLGDDGSLAAGAIARWRYRVTLPTDADLSRLYYRESDRDGEMYRWPASTERWAEPGNGPVMTGGVNLALEVGGLATPLSLETPARYVGVDKAMGEFEEPVLVVPPVSVEPETATLAWPRGTEPRKELRVRVRSFADGPVSGQIRLEAPEGWTVSPPRPVSLAGPGAEATVAFEVSLEGAADGRHRFRAVAALDGGTEVDQAVTLIDYPHIERTAMIDPARVEVSLFPVTVADVTVGYLMGSGDDGLLALRQMGVDAREVTPAEIADGVPDDLDVLVLGIRVYETRPEAAAVNDRILAFAESGGTVLVQYNKYEYPQGGFAPYEVSMGRPAPRVTDENSPVRILDTSHPAIDGPNTITEEDFEGWIQERGLYFLRDWASQFEPVLAFTDPGEDPALGSLLVAPEARGSTSTPAFPSFGSFPPASRGPIGSSRTWYPCSPRTFHDLRRGEGPHR